MPSIRIPAAIEEKIRDIVYAGTLETGVTLFGRKTEDGQSKWRGPTRRS